MENIPLILSQYQIPQYFISFSLKDKFSNFNNVYYDLYSPTLFIGIFNELEIKLINEHKGDIYIIWFGNDCNPKYDSRISKMKNISRLNIKKHFCLTEITNQHLKDGNIIIDYEFYNHKFELKNLQISVSSSLSHLEERIKKKYNLLDYTDISKPCVFFGVYNDNDISLIEAHKGIKYVMWGGSDCSFSKRKKKFNKIKEMLNVLHIAISQNMMERLKRYNFLYNYINLNLVDNNIFTYQKNRGSKIFIYNGYSQGNEEIYGKDIYEKVVKVLPEYDYIYSNNLNCNYVVDFFKHEYYYILSKKTMIS